MTKLVSEIYGKKTWDFLIKVPSGKVIEIIFNHKKDSATIEYKGRGVTGSLNEIDLAEDLARDLIRKKRNEVEV